LNQPTQPPSERECEIFLGALEQPTASGRAAYLDRACGGDRVLRAAVEGLLSSHRDDEFLETPVLRAPNATTVLAGSGDRGAAWSGREKPGDRIGRYKLLQQIGEGGVGTVFLAEQEEPVRRRVALKVLKPGMDTKSVIARFETERQALALMDHPHIAKVLDAGATEAGRPFFVMELVRGVRITDYCDEHSLATRERLVLFNHVCQAIQHAHQKGIIHRDIKPSNILVTVQDGPDPGGCPKVIDFGIAKATSQRLTDKTVLTEIAAFIGTPAYMSPEQAEMTGLDIDTRTDIYSLGVLLYELLTGRTPFDAQELMAAGLDDMRRTIREPEPVPPSTRLRTMLDADQTTTARRQQSEPARLAGVLRGDLDWIVLKALEKDRTRRYETPSSLAADVQRFLNNEPVLARPPSTWYRCQKLVRRNKLAFGVAAAFAAALVLGLALSTWQYLEKSRAYRRATDAEREQAVLRLEAERQALAARRKAYAADVNVVQQALLANNLGRAQELLAGQRPAPQGAAAGKGVVDLRGWEWRYLWQHCQSDALFTLCERSNEVCSLAVSGDARWVAVGDADGGLAVWDLADRTEVARWEGGGGRAQAVFSPVAPLLALSSSEGALFPGRHQRVRLWHTIDRRDLGDVPLDSTCLHLDFAPDGTRLMVAEAAGRLTLWSVPDGKPLGAWSLPEAARLGPIQVAPDFSLVAYATDAGQLRVLDLATNEVRWAAQAATETLTALAFSPDSKILASGAGYVESGIRVWEAASGTLLARLEGHRTWVSALVFRPDGDSLVSASGDQTIRLWNVAGLRSLADRTGPGRARRFLPSEPGAGSAPSPSEFGREESRDAEPGAFVPREPAGDAGKADLVSGEGLSLGAALELAGPPPGAGPGGRNRPLPPWLAGVRPVATLRGHRQEVWSRALSGDGVRLVSGGKDGSVCVGDTTRLRRDQTRGTIARPVRAWRFAADSQSIVGVLPQGQLVRWLGVEFQESRTELELGGAVANALFSPDGRWLTAAMADGTVRVWDLPGSALRHTWDAGASRVYPVGFVPGSSHLLTRGLGEEVLQEWDLASGQEVRSWLADRELGPRSALGFSADGHWSFRLDADGVGRLRELRSSEETILDLSMRQIAQVAFSPDGSRFAAVSRLGTGELWETAPVRRTATLHGFLQAMNAVAFSPDGRRLAIGGDGSEAVKLWDVESLQELLTLEGQGSSFSTVAFSPDGNILAASNGQGMLHLWFAPSLAEIQQAELARP